MAERRILIVDNSELFSRLMENIINTMKGFDCCGIITTSKNLEEKVLKIKPDIMIVDLELDNFDCITFLKNIIPKYAVPVIVCSHNRSKSNGVFDVGAVAYLPKPGDGKYEVFKDNLIRSLQTVSNLKKIKCNNEVYPALNYTLAKKNNSKVVAIGGSTGSTEALPTILKGLNKSIPPIVCTIHMPAGYTKLLVGRMRMETSLNVLEAKNGIYLESGMVVIAQGEEHLRVLKDGRGYFVSSKPGQRISGHCPSADVLFESVSMSVGENAIGVILTGMGKDGSIGLKKMRDAGAYTIGQDERSCLVYGMPKEAYLIGAVCRQISLNQIANEINTYLKEG